MNNKNSTNLTTLIKSTFIHGLNKKINASYNMILIITTLLSQKYNMYHIEKYNDCKSITLFVFIEDIYFRGPLSPKRV